MSLITRCPACGTLFRVVPDQLRVSEGWVRCGQCEEVFDGQANLQTAPPPQPAPQLVPVNSDHFSETMAAPLEVRPSMLYAPTAVAPLTNDEGEPSRVAPGEPTHDPVAVPASSAGEDDILHLAREAEKERREYDWGDVIPSDKSPASGALTAGAGVGANSSADSSAGFPQATEGSTDALPEALADAASVAADPLLDKSPNELAAAASALAPGDWSVSPLEELSGFSESAIPESLRYVQSDSPLPQPVDVPRPAFMVKKKGRLGPLSSPRLMWPLSVLLGGALLLQAVLHERDRLAASVPALEPGLVSLCSLLGCQISPPRNIAAITIESSSFTKVRADVFRLSFALKNSGPMPLAMPAVELTLSDSQDQTLLRRVLLPQDFAGKRDNIAPGSEISMSLPVQVRPGTQAEKVSSYVVLGFYP